MLAIKIILTHASFSHDGNRVVTANNDNTAWIIDKRIEKMYEESTTPIRSHSSINGRRVEFKSSNDTVQVIVSQSQRVVGKLTEYSNNPIGIVSAVYRDDYHRIVAANTDGTLSLFDSQSGNLTHKFKGNRGGITSFAFSNDNRRIVVIDDVNTIRVWDKQSANLLYEIDGGQDKIVSADFSSSDSQVVTVTNDGTVTSWNTYNLQELLAVSCGLHRVPILKDNSKASEACANSTSPM